MPDPHPAPKSEVVSAVLPRRASAAITARAPRPVAYAIEQTYRPRFAGDTLPEGPIASAVALADKLDSLAGLFSIKELPTGEKDPFGLRRAALGVIRIVAENQLPLSLKDLVDGAFGPFRGKPQTDLKEIGRAHV